MTGTTPSPLRRASAQRRLVPLRLAGDRVQTGVSLVQAVRHLRMVPVRFLLTVLAVHAVLVIGVGQLVELLISEAITRAGLTSLTDRNVTQLFSSGPSMVLLALSAICITVITVAYFAMFLAIADLQLAGRRPSLRLLARRVIRAFRRTLRIEGLLLAVQLVLLAPLAGLGVFAPLTADVAPPPFVEREFLKVPLSALLWDGIAAVLVWVAIMTILTFPLVVVDGVRPARGFLRSVASAVRDWRMVAILAGVYAGFRLATLVIDTVTDAIEDAVSPGVLADSVIDAGAGIALLLLSLGAAMIIAFVLVGRARQVSGRAVMVMHPARRHRPTQGVLIVARAAVAMVLVVGAMVISVAEPSVAIAQSRPMVFAHRGYDSGGVENTIAALDAAAAVGVDAVEVDIQQTADGGFVASHDTNLFVLSGVNRNIYEMTTAEVTSTTVTMKGLSGTIPTMAEYAQRARELGMPLLIEFKVTGNETPDFLDAALAELATIGPLDANTYHSLSPELVAELSALHPELRVGLTIGMFVGDLPDVDVDFYTLEQASVTLRFIDDAHTLGREVYAWTVDDPDTMRTLLGSGIDGFVTDDPIAARDARAGAPLAAGSAIGW